MINALPAFTGRPIIAWRIVFALAAPCAGAIAQEIHWKQYGDWQTDQLGFAVAGIGDVNGDGVPDVAAGIPLEDRNGTDAGAVRVFSGSDGTTLFTFYGDAVGDSFGYTVAPAGDFNQDGRADLIVGAPEYLAGGNAGYAYVLSGRDASISFVMFGDGYQDWFGSAVAGGGDLDGDGWPDVIVGASNHAQGSEARVGMVRAFSSRTHAEIFTRYGESGDDRFGASVAILADQDGDGAAEFAVGAPGPVLPKRAYVNVFSGANASVLLRFEGSAVNNDNFGSRVAAMLDATGDGVGELIVSAPFADHGHGEQSGAVYAYQCRVGDVFLRIEGDHPGDALGLGAAGGFDFNDDGVGDLAAGAPVRGLVKICSGRFGRTLYAFHIPDASATRFGHAVAAAGDLDGDGIGDVVVGAPDEPGLQLGVGSATVFLGHELLLQVEPRTLSAGQLASLAVRDGPWQQRLGLFVVEAGGTPTFALVAHGRYWIDHGFALQGTVPPGIGPIDLVLQAFGVDYEGGLAVSNGERLTIE